MHRERSDFIPASGYGEPLRRIGANGSFSAFMKRMFLYSDRRGANNTIKPLTVCGNQKTIDVGVRELNSLTGSPPANTD